ncbi:MAG: hypothetical protein AB7S26_28640 [Sandaracinaceae bacterium]
MGFFEDMFDPDFAFDSEYQQRQDIRSLQAHADAGMATASAVHRLEGEIARLTLIVNALASALEQKGIATSDELQVLVQQIDLADGTENGRMSPTTWKSAPQCAHCGYFVNPQREACVYCGRSLAVTTSGSPYRGGTPSARAKSPRLAACQQCSARVPQNETYFTEQGALRCSECFQKGQTAP